MKVKLLSWWGPGDVRVAEAAWASTYDKDKWENRTEQQRSKVLDIVVGQKHGTPLESVWMEFYIECPIFVERQFDKYRMTQQYQDIHTDINLDLEKQYKKYSDTYGKSGDATYSQHPLTTEAIRNTAEYFLQLLQHQGVHIIEYNFAPMSRDSITQNELSGRYRTLPSDFIDMPDDVADILLKANKSVSYYEKTAIIRKWSAKLQAQYEEYIQDLKHLKQCVSDKLITQQEYKRVREFIRGSLGTAFYTHMKILMNLRAFENIMNERLANDAQVEAQQLAKLMFTEVCKSRFAEQAIHNMAIKNNWPYTRIGNTIVLARPNPDDDITKILTSDSIINVDEKNNE